MDCGDLQASAGAPKPRKSPHSNAPCSIWHTLDKQHRGRLVEASKSLYVLDRTDLKVRKNRRKRNEPRHTVRTCYSKMPRAPVEASRWQLNSPLLPTPAPEDYRAHHRQRRKRYGDGYEHAFRTHAPPDAKQVRKRDLPQPEHKKVDDRGRPG